MLDQDLCHLWRSTYLGILTLEVSIILEHLLCLPIFLISPASSLASLTRLSSVSFFRIFCWGFAISLFVRGHWSKVDSSRLTRRWVILETPIRHSSSPQISPYWKTNDLRSGWARSSHLFDIAPQTLNWFTEMMRRNNNSAVVKSPL